MKINPQIFREYDIRGTVDKDLSEEFAFQLGRAYGELAREKGKDNIAIGFDCRLSSEPYAKALARGVADSGRKVIISGMGPTPQVYYAIYSRNLGGGIQVTGSHNPPDMNGFKICLGTNALCGAEIQDLRARMERLIKSDAGAAGGAIIESPIRSEYIQALIDNSKPHMGARKLKVVVDGGNGVGGMVGPQVLRALGVDVSELYCEPDGRFPNHHPDPTVPENLEQLIKTVKDKRADFGIGWDGDADRIGVVDENGGIIFGDLLLLIYARQVLKEVPGATIIADVKCSSRLFDDLRGRGARVLMWKTGHSLIKGKLKELKGELGGEMSGHICFSHRYYGFDDALYCSARLVEIASKMQGPFSGLLSDVPAMVATPEIRVDCPEEIKFKISERAKEAFKEFEVSTIDGVRISFPEGWGLVRASNTQPVLVMRFEASTPAKLEEYQRLVSQRIDKIKRELQA